MGSNVRVGLEDSLWARPGQAREIERRPGQAWSARSSRDSACRSATPDEAREILSPQRRRPGGVLACEGEDRWKICAPIIDDCKTSLGEGPLWDVEEQERLYWIDSLGSKRVSAPSRRHRNGDLGSAADRSDPWRCARGGGAVLCLQTRLLSSSISTAAKSHSSSTPSRTSRQSPERRQGRPARPLRLSARWTPRRRTRAVRPLPSGSGSSVHKLDDGIIVSNGPCWSPDDRTFYFADTSMARRSTPTIGTARPVRSRSGPFAPSTTPARAASRRRDGGREGFLGRPRSVPGELLRFTPDGKLDRSVRLPVGNRPEPQFRRPKPRHHFRHHHRPGPSPAWHPMIRRRAAAVRGPWFGVKGLPEPRFAG